MVEYSFMRKFKLLSEKKSGDEHMPGEYIKKR